MTFRAHYPAARHNPCNEQRLDRMANLSCRSSSLEASRRSATSSMSFRREPGLVRSTGRRPRNLPAKVKSLPTITLQGERPSIAAPVFRHPFWRSHFPGRFLGRVSPQARQLPRNDSARCACGRIEYERNADGSFLTSCRAAACRARNDMHTVPRPHCGHTAATTRIMHPGNPH